MPGISLLVGCKADRAFRMACSINVVVKGFYQSGKQQKADKKQGKAFEHGQILQEFQ